MKATKAEVRQRVEELLKIRLAGAEFQDVREYAIAKGWSVSRSQLWKYVQRGDRLLARTLEKNRDKLLNRHMAMRRALFAKAIDVGDLRTALSVLIDECKLLGLYPSEKVQLSGPNGAPIQHEIEHSGRVAVDVFARIEQYDEAFAKAADRQNLDADQEAAEAAAIVVTQATTAAAWTNLTKLDTSQHPGEEPTT